MNTTTPTEPSSKPARRLSLTSLIWIGLFAGLALGLFIGEYAARLRVVGDIYVGLLQMTVLPYIVVSLITNIGRMSFTEARVLAGKGLIVILCLWGIGAAAVFILGMAFPTFSTGAFFSTSLIESPKYIDFMSLFVPSNPFRSVTFNLVPAVVLFCILFGVAAIGVKDKQTLLNHFDLMAQILRRMNGFIIKLTPLGLFAIAASAAGTLTLQEFGRLQGYLLTFTLGVLFLAGWVLPMTIAACTRFTYLDVLSASKNALITAFILNSTFVVIPMLIESVNQLFAQYAEKEESSDARPEFIIPLGYPFPDIGRILSLIFIPFATWFYSGTVSMASYAFILPVGLVLSFGNIVTTIPFLLDGQKLPADIFQLFLMSGVWASRVGDLMATMHLFTFTILTTAAIRGWLRIRWSKMAFMTVISVLLAVLTITGIHLYLNSRFKDSYRKDQIIANMQLLEGQVEAVQLPRAEPNPVKLDSNQSRLDRIKQRGIIRIGFNPDRLPFSYRNPKGELVGFDVDLVHHLALDLGVTIEFVPYAWQDLEKALDQDHFDLAISGITATLKRSEKILFSDAYLMVNTGLVVEEHRRKDFSSLDAIRKLGPVRVGVIKDGLIFAERVHELLDNVEVVELPTEQRFFQGKDMNLDALVTTAEGGAAWTLIYPQYAIVSPLDPPNRVPLVLGLAERDPKFEEYLNNWVRLNRLNNTIDELVNHWIYGRTAVRKKPRWSFMRNVLHWIE
ncbi:MAG: cation:dicarboxylase symporter family transporter [Desulfobacteraceae bacterium]|jgi:Na+/H+-dicarboxylate symporter